MTKLDLKTVVYKDGKYFVAQCLDIDVSSFGKTEKAALDNLKEALELYLEDANPKNVKPTRTAKIRTLQLQSA